MLNTTKTAKNLTLPLVHLNGTGRDALLREYEEAAHAVMAAIRAMEKITVHGRDYYPLDKAGESGAVFRKAMGEHMDRAGKLNDVHEELVQMWEQIGNSGK